MPIILPPAETTFFDNNGDPLALGTVSFYLPGTLTPKDTYQDLDATIPNTNPVQLDAAGRAIIVGLGRYRQIVKDALGNTIWDQNTGDSLVGIGQPSIAALRALATTAYAANQVVEVLGYYTQGDGGGGLFAWAPTSTVTDNGGTVIKPTAVSGAGRWQRIYSGALNLRWFGAKGDDSADDLTAISNWIAALPALGGRLYAPGGHYRYSAALPTINVPVVLFGDGAGTGLTDPGIPTPPRPTVFRPAAGVPGLTIGPASENSLVTDLYFQSLSGGAGTDDGLILRGAGVRVEAVVCEHFGRRGFDLDTSSGGNVNVSKLVRCRAYLNSSHGFYAKGVNSNAVTYDTCDATKNGGIGFTNECANCLYLNPHADQNAGGSFYDNGNSNQYISPYVEGSPSDAVLFNTLSSRLLWLAGGYTLPTITDLGTDNTILRMGAFEALRSKQLQLLGVPAPDLQFVPSTGATRTAQIYQSGNTLYIADKGDDNRWELDLMSKAIHSYGPLYPATPGAAKQSQAAILAGTGVPTLGNDGDFYFRSDGGTGTAIYQKRAGTWVAVA